MKIAVDGRLAFRERPRGMGRVALELMRSVVELAQERDDLEVVFYTDESKGVPDEFTLVTSVIKPKLFAAWEQWALPKACKRDSVDILICPYNTGPLRLGSKTKLEMVIHDAMFAGSWKVLLKRQSNYQRLGSIYRRLVALRVARSADAIITVSQYSKAQISERLRLNIDRIDVVNPSIGYLESVRPDSLYIEENSLGSQRYLLHVGGIAHNKNSQRAIDVLTNLYESGFTDTKLVLIGIPPGDQKRFVSDLPSAISDQIIFQWSVTDEQLAALYCQAVALLVTSTDEGFGLPVIEAMYWNCPVVGSAAGSIPEAAGGAALLVESDQAEQYTEQLVKLMTTPELNDKLTEMGKQRIELLSPARIRSVWKARLTRAITAENRHD